MRLDQMPTADQLKHRSANFLELLKTTGSADNRQVTTAVANDVIASGVTPQIQLG
jgi:hypothetical protein